VYYKYRTPPPNDNVTIPLLVVIAVLLLVRAALFLGGVK